MWSLPTRGRPSSLQRFINEYKNTGASSKVYVRLDDDDLFLDEYKKIELPSTFILKIDKRIGLKASMEEMFHAYPNEAWYGLAADDLIPKTPKWDSLLIQSAGLRGISYPNDLGENITLPTHPVVGGDLVRAVGWFGHPATYHFYLDNAWQFIGENLNCIARLDNVIVEHNHYTFNKSELDQTYLDRKPDGKKDKRLYFNWMEQHGQSLLTRLKELGF
jgi:hypothetical protein